MTEISVVVATRNRPAHAAECVARLLATSGYAELIVIDQSDNDRTECALACTDDARLRYVRTETRGVTRARNLGIDLAVGDVVAFTDDDCRIAADWPVAISAVFASDPDAAVVCGRVRVAEGLQSLGFTESFEPHRREWLGEYPPFGRDWGITANLALRRNVVDRVGKFDPLLGAGAPLRSGGEPDFIYRVLRSGLKVVNASEVVVDHLGVRACGHESRELIRGYGFGTGAAFFKHVRLGDMAAFRIYMSFVLANVARILRNLSYGRGPVGLGYLVAFLLGAAQSFRFGVDRNQRLFVGH